MKRKMLTVNALAVGNLKHRRKQYTIMIAGILLAMIFSSSVLFFIFSLNASEAEMKRNLYGNQNMAYFDADADIMKEAQEKGVTEDYAFAHLLGYAYTEEETLGAGVAWCDDAFRRVQYQSLLEGTYPSADNEIAAEKNALVRLGAEPVIGTKIKVKLKVQNGMKWLEEPVEKEYTVVGILRDKKSNIMQHYWSGDEQMRYLPALFVKENTAVEPGGKENLVCYFRVAKFDKIYNEKSAEYKFFEDKGLNLWSEHFMELNSRWFGSGLGDLSGKIGFAIVMAIVLTAASSLIIINSFNANLKERKKQIGMLRAVGATRRQIILVFSREALLISLLCAPVSLVASLFGVKLLTHFLFDESFIFVAKWWVLIACLVFSVVMVMFASLIPLVSASKITPMQAIRNIDAARKLKNKKIKTQRQFKAESLLAKRNKALHRGSRFAVIFMLIITIIISCVGFTALREEYNYTYNSGYDYEFWGMSGDYYSDLYNTNNPTGYTENERQKMLSFPYIKTAEGIKNARVNVVVPQYDDFFNVCAADYSPYLWHNYELPDGRYMPISSDEWQDYLKTAEFSEEYLEVKKRLNVPGEYFAAQLSAGSNEALASLESAVTDGSINMSKLNTGEEILLVAPQKIAYRVDYEKRYDSYSSWFDKDEDIKPDKEYIAQASLPYRAGDKLTLDILTASAPETESDEEGEYYTELIPKDLAQATKEVTIGAIISPSKVNDMQAMRYTYFDSFGFITTVQGMDNLIPGRKYENMSFTAATTLDDEIDKEITEYLEPFANKYDAQVESIYKMQKEQKTAVRTVMMSLAAVIILFFAISASIINNSLAAGIRENKRELGTLRAVGASAGVLVMSYIKQLISMFAWGYGLGFAVSALIFIGIGIWGKVTEGEFAMPSVMVLPSVLMCILLFAVCALNLWSKVHKEMKNSIVENIREL